MNSQTDPGLGELLRHLLELTDGSTDKWYREQDFSYRPRYTPIMRVLQYGSASVTDLQERLSVTQGAISQTIRLMLEDGLIEKRKGKDARQAILSLSAHGRDALRTLSPHWDAIYSAIEQLESEIKVPLMKCLSMTVEALEKKTYSDRINDCRQDVAATTDQIEKKNFFQNEGEIYANFRPSYPSDLSHSLSELSAHRSLALDIGCGNGQLTTLLSPHFDQVIGTDPSKDQLNYAETAHNVSYLQETAEEIGVSDNSVDLLVVAQAAHWFDLKKFYSEVRRVAKEEAVLALVSYGVPYIADPVNAIFQQGYWQDVHEFWPPERAHVETGYADIYFPFSSIDFPNHCYRKDMSVEHFISYITTWSAYKSASHRDRQEKFDHFFAKLRRAWRKDDLKEVVWPISVRAAYVHK